MGATWPRCASIPPFPGAAGRGLQSEGNISVVASGCSWLPPFPWMPGARAPLGLPQQCPACSPPAPPSPPGFSHRSLSGAKPRGTAFPGCVCVVLGARGVPIPMGAWVSLASATVSSANGATGDGTIPGEMCPPGGPDPAKKPCSGCITLPWRDVWVESNVARKEER